MAEIAVAVASEVAKCLVAPVGRHCGYVIFCDRHVCELSDEVKKLDNTRQRVQHRIDEAENNARQIEADVREWMNKEKTVANKVHNVLNDNTRAKKTCFYGWLPNPKARYHLGKEARKTVKDIQELIARGQFDKVDFENPPTGRVDGAPGVNSSAGNGGDFITDSRASIFQGIMKALNDEKVKVVGVYGPGGVGKSTLLKIVQDKLKKEEKQKKEERLFHMIVKAEVLRTPDLINIQGQIADALSLNLKDKETQQGRRDLLFQRLQKDPNEKFLIILDDLWGALDLEAVGIPSGDKSMNCKLLLTSRDKSVLERMHADQTFRLEALEEGEAFRLFEKKVGDKLKDNEELKIMAAKVVKKLAGLPLLITSVATTLNRKNVSTWESMLIKIEDPNIERIVKWSYDHLESEDAKCLFLLCGLIGGTIKVKLLLGLGMGLGLFEGYNKSVQHSRIRLNEILDSLHSFCLLQDGGDGKKNVTIHDLYSEVVVSHAFRGENSLMMNSNYGPRSKEMLEKCWAMCLADVAKDRPDKLMTFQFPHLKILMLSRPDRRRWMQEHNHEVGDCSGLPDFTYMKELRVLYFRCMDIARLPLSIGILGNLHSLNLDHCHVEDVAILGELKALQILSFAWSTISKLPEEIGKLTNLRSLNLNHCNSLGIIMPGVLKSLINLEELHMKKSFDEWMDEYKLPLELHCAGLVELKNLTKLASLKISIRDPVTLSQDGDLPFENLDKFWINIGGDYRGAGGYKGLTTMELKLNGYDSILSKEWVKKNLQKTQYLYLSNLSEFEESPRELCTQGFREVKYLHVDYSPSIKYIANSFNADSSNGLPLIAFGKLESLILENLINLEKICHGPVTTESFNKLRAISVTQCDRLKYLWSLSETQRLVHLEEIDVRECNSMQYIITHDAGEGIVSTDNRVELPKVRCLTLRELPNMSGNPLIIFGKLESLILENFIKLEKICHVLVTTESFSKLRSIRVERCDQLKYLWSLSDAQRLVQLEEIDVRKCNSMRYIITHDAGVDIVSTDNRIELPKLRRLRLRELPDMWGFCTKADITSEDTRIQVSLPHLESLEMDEFLGQENIFYGERSLKYSNLRSLTIANSKSKLKTTLRLGWILKLPNLESLVIRCSPLAEINLELEVTEDVNILSRLTLLRLYRLPNLQCMWKRDVKLQGISILRNLREVYVFEIGLSFLFSASMAKCLREIRVITVMDCPNMMAMIVDEGRDEGIDDIIEFPLLEQLIIQCPMEKFFQYPHGNKEMVTTTADSQDANSDSFFDQKVTFPNIKELIISGLECKELWNNQIPTDSFQKLEILQLSDCDSLQRIATSDMWKKLQHCLKELKVSSCRSIQIIYEGNGMDIETSKLRRLVLLDLRNLWCIWPYDSLPNILFPNLREVEARRCPCLEVLLPTFTAKSLGQIKYLTVESCENMELIASHEKWEEATSTTITFSQLTHLGLFELPKFKSFLPEKYSLKFACSKDFPSLRVLRIESCGAEPDQVLGVWNPSYSVGTYFFSDPYCDEDFSCHIM